MVSLNSQPLAQIAQSLPQLAARKTVANPRLPQKWNYNTAWKSSLNNIRLLMQPLISLWLIFPWLDVFPNRNLLLGFHKLIHSVAHLHPYFSSA